MESDNILSGLADNLSQQVLKEVSAKVNANLQDTINRQLDAINVAARVDEAAKAEAKVAAVQYQPNLKAIDKQLAASTKAIVDNISATASRLVNEAITARISSIDFDGAIASALTSIIDSKLKDFTFPDNSINSTAVKQVGTISGDTVKGGIITEFGSTGIDDKATDCRVTIMDDVTVIENNLLTKDLTVKGNIVQQGNYYETFSKITNSGGNLTCDFNNGSIFNVTSISTNVTANFINLNAIDRSAVGATVVVNQGATAYVISNVQINGVNQRVRWVNGQNLGVAPTGLANNNDIISFRMLYLGNGNYRIYGQLSSY